MSSTHRQISSAFVSNVHSYRLALTSKVVEHLNSSLLIKVSSTFHPNFKSYFVCLTAQSSGGRSTHFPSLSFTKINVWSFHSFGATRVCGLEIYHRQTAKSTETRRLPDAPAGGHFSFKKKKLFDRNKMARRIISTH